MNKSKVIRKKQQKKNNRKSNRKNNRKSNRKGGKKLKNVKKQKGGGYNEERWNLAKQCAQKNGFLLSFI